MNQNRIKTRFTPLRAASWAAGTLIALTAAPPLGAQPFSQSHTYSKQEMALLPPYCKYAQNYRDRLVSPEEEHVVKEWYAKLGPMFHHFHHYCGGLNHLNNASFRSRNDFERREQLGHAVKEVTYVITSAPRGYVLLPEFHTKRAEAYARLGQHAQAIPDLFRAIQLKPDYWPPYVALSDYYLKQGETAKAREWAEKGLQQLPDSKALKAKLAEVNRPRASSKESAATQADKAPAPSTAREATPDAQSASPKSSAESKQQ